MKGMQGGFFVHSYADDEPLYYKIRAQPWYIIPKDTSNSIYSLVFFLTFCDLANRTYVYS